MAICPSHRTALPLDLAGILPLPENAEREQQPGQLSHKLLLGRFAELEHSLLGTPVYSGVS